MNGTNDKHTNQIHLSLQLDTINDHNKTSFQVFYIAHLIKTSPNNSSRLNVCHEATQKRHSG